MLRFDKATYVSLLFKFILSERLSSSLWGSDVLLFLEFINMVSTLSLELYWIHYIVIYFFSNLFCSIQLEYIICLILLSKFSNVLPVFTCASVVSSLWNICLGNNVSSPSPYFALYLASNSKKRIISKKSPSFLLSQQNFQHFVLHLFDPLILILDFFFYFA